MEFEATFTPSEISVTSFDFEDGQLPTDWEASPFLVATPCDPPRGDTTPPSNYFWATTLYTGGGENNGKRFVQTSAVDVSEGGSIEFIIRYGADDPYVSNGTENCEDGDAANEEVYLQYSANGGAWVTMYDDWDTVNGYGAAWYNWHFNDIAIPDGAKSSSTRFRWRQPANSGFMYDNWGLDDIKVKAIPPPSASWEASYSGLSSDSINVASNTVSFTKLFPPSNVNKDYSITVSTTLTNGTELGVSKTVNVEASDTTNPTITVPSDVVTDTLTGLCKTSVILGTPITSDECNGENYIGTIAGFSGNLSDYEYPIGITTITWTVSDTAGNTVSSNQFVTVEDNEKPVLIIPTDIVTSTCIIDFGTQIATATDNCSTSLTPSYLSLIHI